MRDYTTDTVSQQDTGLRDYMLRIYNYMTVGLFITGGIAYFSSRSQPFINAMYQIQGNNVVGMRPMGWVVMLAPLVFVMLFSFGLQRMSAMAAQVSFWIYSVLIGLSLSNIFLTFTGQSIAQAFFVTAATFGGMSLYGYTTRRDLTGVGSFMFMGLIGVIIASLVNLFLHSPGLQFVISIISVIVFVGLTAFDVQKLKQLYVQTAGQGEMAEKIAIFGALTLYLDFINIFLNLLMIFGNRRDG